MFIFMNKTDFQKLTLLKLIFHTTPDSTFSHLSQQMDLSQRTIERYLKDIETDCQAIPELKDFYFKKIDSHITAIFPNNLSPHYISDRLHVSYTEKSIEFNIIRTLLLKKYNSLNELADELFISPSSLYRLLYKLEPMMEKFDIKFSFFDSHSDLNIHYDEKKLRLFSYYFYWNSLKGLHLEPFDEHKMLVKEIDDAIAWGNFNSLLPSKKEQIRYLCTITSLRVKVSKQELVLPPDLIKIAQIFMVTNDLSLFLAPLRELPVEHIERQFFNIFSRIIMGEIDSFEQKKEMFDAFSKEDLSLVNDCHNLLHSFENHFKLSLSEEDYVTFFYYFLQTFIFLDYFQVGLPVEFKGFNDLDLFNKKTDLSKSTILKQATDFYETCQFSITIPKEHERIIIATICSIIEVQDNPPLKIAIQYSKNTVGAFLIRKKIQQFFSHESFIFTNDYSQIDIVISDCFVPVNTDVRYFFYMDSLDGELRWNALFDYLAKVLKDSNFSYQ